MSKIVEFVRQFVKEKHSKQRRWNGDLYYTHLEAVEEIAIDLLTEKHGWEIPSDAKDYTILRIIALSHDVAEDVDEFKDKEYELVAIYRKADTDKELDERDWAIIVESLKRLNKHRSKNYLEFVLVAKEDFFAAFAKQADLLHNSSDLKSGNMRDKYLMALYILQH